MTARRRVWAATLVVLAAAGARGRAAAPARPHLLVYGDTRTGSFVLENHDNDGQRIHHWLVTDMLHRVEGAPATVVFTGDAVFSGASHSMWIPFLGQVDRFRARGYRFLPALGNHELYPRIVGAVTHAGKEPPPDPTEIEIPPADLEAWAAPWHALQRTVPGGTGMVVPAERAAEYEEQDRKMEEREPRVEAAIYHDRNLARRAARGREIFRRHYVAGFGAGDLAPILGDRTYYATLFVDGAREIALVVLDTNTLEDPAQLAWFGAQVAAAGGRPMIVIGHHPPGTRDGWGPWLRYLTDDRIGGVANPIRLWIFGHEHAFEEYVHGRADRAVLIAGGGGAPLKKNRGASRKLLTPAGGWTWTPPPPGNRQSYHYLDLTLDGDALAVEVVGGRSTAVPPRPLGTLRVSLL